MMLPCASIECEEGSPGETYAVFQSNGETVTYARHARQRLTGTAWSWKPVPGRDKLYEKPQQTRKELNR